MKSADDVIKMDLEYIVENLKDDLHILSGKKILITGGAGFLGYYLVKSILHWNVINNLKDPIKIIVHDNFMRGVPEWLSNYQQDQNLILKKHDVREKLPQDVGAVQYIIHAASIASPTYYRMYPIETMDANVNGLRHLLDYAANQKEMNNEIKGFLYFSTSEIYGDPVSDYIPTPENYRGHVSCTGPRACYDESKRYGETLCVNFSKQYQLPIRIVRPFNNYGPGLKITDRRALPDFARNIFNDENIVLLSDGAPTRTFCYVADAIVGYMKVLINGHHGEAYNIGVDKPEISILQLAENVISIARDLFDYQGELIFDTSDDKEYLTDNPNRRCPVIDKAQEHLGYKPTIALKDGLTRSLYWYKDNLCSEDS
jgi:nucleoside-diphosphate-sugar epimerase